MDFLPAALVVDSISDREPLLERVILVLAARLKKVWPVGIPSASASEDGELDRTFVDNNGDIKVTTVKSGCSKTSEEKSLIGNQ